MANKKKARIVALDDEEVQRNLIREIIMARTEYEPVVFDNFEEAKRPVSHSLHLKKCSSCPNFSFRIRPVSQSGQLK